MSNLKNFKTVSTDKYTKDDVKAIDSFKPHEKKFGREVLSVSISKEIKTWLDDVVKYLNHQSKRKITRSDLTFLALTQLKGKSNDKILQELRHL